MEKLLVVDGEGLLKAPGCQDYVVLEENPECPTGQETVCNQKTLKRFNVTFNAYEVVPSKVNRPVIGFILLCMRSVAIIGPWWINFSVLVFTGFYNLSLLFFQKPQKIYLEFMFHALMFVLITCFNILGVLAITLVKCDWFLSLCHVNPEKIPDFVTLYHVLELLCGLGHIISTYIFWTRHICNHKTSKNRWVCLKRIWLDSEASELFLVIGNVIHLVALGVAVHIISVLVYHVFAWWSKRKATPKEMNIKTVAGLDKEPLKGKKKKTAEENEKDDDMEGETKTVLRGKKGETEAGLEEEHLKEKEKEESKGKELKDTEEVS